MDEHIETHLSDAYRNAYRDLRKSLDELVDTSTNMSDLELICTELSALLNEESRQERRASANLLTPLQLHDYQAVIHALEKMGLTHKEIAHINGTCRASISRWSCGNGGPSISQHLNLVNTYRYIMTRESPREYVQAIKDQYAESEDPTSGSRSGRHIDSLIPLQKWIPHKHRKVQSFTDEYPPYLRHAKRIRELNQKTIREVGEPCDVVGQTITRIEKGTMSLDSINRQKHQKYIAWLQTEYERLKDQL